MTIDYTLEVLNYHRIAKKKLLPLLNNLKHSSLWAVKTEPKVYNNPYIPDYVPITDQ